MEFFANFILLNHGVMSEFGGRPKMSSISISTPDGDERGRKRVRREEAIVDESPDFDADETTLEAYLEL